VLASLYKKFALALEVRSGLPASESELVVALAPPPFHYVSGILATAGLIARKCGSLVTPFWEDDKYSTHSRKYEEG